MDVDGTDSESEFDIDITFQTAIIKNNPKKAVRSVGDGEVLETLSTYIFHSQILRYVGFLDHLF